MDLALVAARFTHFAATMTLFGATFYAAALAPASHADALKTPLRWLAPTLALVSLAAAVAWLVYVAQSMAGDGVDVGGLRDVLADTGFGAVWRVRLVLLGLLLVSTLMPDRRWRVPAALAGLAMASLGLVGHAAMQEGFAGAAHRLNHAVHLIATSVWLGGLPLFLVSLCVFLREPQRRDALAAMMRYSAVGHGAVATVLVSGALDIAMTSQAWPWPPSNPYRLALDIKIACVAAMVALALVNRYVTAPRVERTPGAAQALAAGALAEIVLGLTAVALVAGFGTFDPH